LQRNGLVKLTRPLLQIRVPTTVQAVLASRIDRLEPDEKELLHTLAVFGRQFPLRLVQQVAQTPTDALDRLLSRLQAGEFIYEQPAFPEVEYIFKHALTQEVAYNSLLMERRKQLHEQAAAAIESIYSGHREDYIEDLAHHYSRSDNNEKALQYLRMAADEASRRCHHNDAVTHAKTALQLLKRLPETPETLRAELALQLRLGQGFAATLGYSASEAGKAFARAAELSERIENASTKFSLLGGLWVYHLVCANHTAAYDFAKELWRIATAAGGASFLIDASYALGVSLFWMGDFAESERILQKGVNEYKPGQPLFNIATSDTLCWLLEYLASCVWHLGYPDRAMELRTRTLERASSIGDPYTAAAARLQIAMVRLLRRDTGADEDAREAIAISRENGFTSTRLWGEANYYSVRLQDGFGGDIPALLDNLQQLRSLGARLACPWFFTIAAAAYVRSGNLSPAVRIIDNNLVEIERSSERQAEAELHRLKGEVLLLQNAPADAEKFFRSAINIARRQSAKSWELRATTSLARLLANHDRRDEAGTMLAKIYGWYTEGFDTADLKEAKKLLEELTLEKAGH
jgi:hypothetical protein